MSGSWPLHANATVSDGPPARSDGAIAALAGVSVRARTEILRERYARELQRLRGEVERLERKLGNERFVEKAAPDVVEAERTKLSGYRDALARADDQLAALER